MLKVSSGILALTLLAAPASAATVVQAGDAGVSEGGATPNSNAAAATFDAANPPTFLETFEDAAATGFTVSRGSITSNPVGGGGSVFGFNTTPGGDFVLELLGGSATFAFLNPVSSFGFKLTGVQLSNLSVMFNDGTAQNVAVVNNGSGVQFFGASGFSNLVTSFTLNASGDAIGVDDLRFSSAAAVPEPATWALMLLGFGFVGGALRSKKRRQNVAVSYA